MTLKELPLGNQSFAEIIDQHLLYADKTRYIYNLVKSKERNFFLSRPRRFGKTLLLNTLAELFSGNRERFQGLWIDQSDYDFPRIPVLSLSLTMTAVSSKVLEKNLLIKLKNIASKAKLSDENKTNRSDNGNKLDLLVKLDNAATPDVYFGSLIQALSEKFQSQIAVLIDEYDYPVTTYMADMEVAEANAKVLHTFFAMLKDIEVSPCVLFTMVTGITRYALTSMDSGPNHLNDISLDPRYAGLCGFTLEEFDSVFADRLESTLAIRKKNGKMDSSATVEELRAEILRWYDGYNWGGETRVLNPYSILHFFKNSYFSDYWIRSGQPGHLSALIKQRPVDFVRPQLDAILSTEVRKTELTDLSVAPVLFHSGYLTVDQVNKVEGNSPGAQNTDSEDSYSFRLPNHEVSRRYYSDCLDCFRVVLNLPSNDALINKGESLKQAFLARDAGQVSSLFSDLFSAISYYQRLEGEKAFHGLIHGIFIAMGFTVLSEIPSSKGRLDLRVELPGQIFLILELKYRANPAQKLTVMAKKILANVARKYLPKAVRYESLAELASRKFSYNEIELILEELSEDESTTAKENYLLAKFALKSLPEKDIIEALASTVLEKLPRERLETELLKLGVKIDLSQKTEGLTDERIDQILTQAAQEALNDITLKDYHGQFRLKAKGFIDLGLAIYDDGSTVKALFGPETAKA
ncbi:MAG: AAA family ATPase [Deltaproteobacteria bacterium]|jgi:hypothetical protein|nr:AAA family ATPase [Deltaproteobacteria bacterium]